MLIKVAEQQAIVKRYGGYRTFVEAQTQARWPGAAVNWETRGAVLAQIVRSMWVAQCPHCGEAIVIEPGEAFFCPGCVMQGNDGYALEIVLPEKRAEIERVLLLRPNPSTRNWVAGETVEGLRDENRKHGITGGLRGWRGNHQ